MLTPDIKLSFWEKVYAVIHQLFIDTEDALDSVFAPYRFKNGVLVEPDKDTPKVKKLFNMLADLDAFLQIEHSRSKAEYTQWEEERDRVLKSYEAWELGLCPKVMLKVSHWYETDGGGRSSGAWEEIAKLKQVQGINKDDTLQAIALWEAHQQLQSQHRAKQKHRRQRAVMQMLLTRTIAKHAQQEMHQVRQMMRRLTTKPALMEWQKTLVDGTVIEIPVMYVPKGHKKPKYSTPLKN